jgi:hypothetical protein
MESWIAAIAGLSCAAVLVTDTVPAAIFWAFVGHFMGW